MNFKRHVDFVKYKQRRTLHSAKSALSVAKCATLKGTLRKLLKVLRMSFNFAHVREFHYKLK